MGKQLIIGKEKMFTDAPVIKFHEVYGLEIEAEVCYPAEVNHYFSYTISFDKKTAGELRDFLNEVIPLMK